LKVRESGTSNRESYFIEFCPTSKYNKAIVNNNEPWEFPDQWAFPVISEYA